MNIPRRLYLPSEFRKYFVDHDILYNNVWRKNNHKVLEAVDGNWYEAEYVSGTPSRQEFILLKKVKQPQSHIINVVKKIAQDILIS